MYRFKTHRINPILDQFKTKTKTKTKPKLKLKSKSKSKPKPKPKSKSKSKSKSKLKLKLKLKNTDANTITNADTDTDTGTLKETFKEKFTQMYHPFQREPISNIESGIFCYMPYDSLDRLEKSIFKIEISQNINNTIKNLQKYYPSGFYVTAILLLKETTTKLEQILKLILNKLINDGGKIQANFETGWIYCAETSIHIIFDKISIENKGILNIYHLSGRNKDTFQMIDKPTTDVPMFTGKVVYHT